MGGVISGGSGKRVADDVQAVVIEPAPVDTTLRVKGVMFTAALGDTTDHELELTEERWLQGMILEIDNHTPGDYAELRIMMPTPEGDVEVNQFAETIFIKPSKQTVMVLQTSTQLPAGLKLKLSYTSVGMTGPAPVVYADYVTWRK